LCLIGSTSKTGEIKKYHNVNLGRVEEQYGRSGRRGRKDEKYKKTVKQLIYLSKKKAFM